MYLPAHFEEKDVAEIFALIEEYPFASLITKIDGVFEATSIPMMVAEKGARDNLEKVSLFGHIASKNPLCALITQAVDCLVIFKGPESYITPNWYPIKADHGKVVPTWNYAEIHCHGTLTLINDSAQKREWVTLLTDKMEALENAPWQVKDAPDDYVTMMLNNIVGVEIAVQRIEAKVKANQNHPTENRVGVTVGLRERGGDKARAMAQLMQRVKY